MESTLRPQSTKSFRNTLYTEAAGPPDAELIKVGRNAPTCLQHLMTQDHVFCHAMRTWSHSRCPRPSLPLSLSHSHLIVIE